MPFIVITPASAALITPGNLGQPFTSTGETLASLRDELILQLGKRTDVSPERATLWINFAYRQLCTTLEIDSLKGSMSFDLVINQPLYLLPSEVRATRDISVINNVTYGARGGIILAKSDLAQYRRRGNFVSEPQSYFREKRVLVFWPTPKNVRTVSMDFWINPADLVNDTDSPIIDKELHESILKNARQKGYSALQDFEKAGVAQNEYVDNVRTQVDPEEFEDDQRVILSSVPRHKSQLRRQSSTWQGDGDGIH